MSQNRFERPAGPSVPAGDGDGFRHTEEQAEPKDSMPASDPEFLPSALAAAPGGDRAVLRLKVEALLGRREAASVEQWRALGPEAVAMLVDLLDDPAVGERMRHTAIATIGQLGQADLAERLGPLLVDRNETALTRTYAASAIGRLGGSRSIAWLSRGLGDPDEMVRLQLARSLARVGGAAAIPSLRALARDEVAAVAEEAGRGLGSVPARPDPGTIEPTGPNRDLPIPDENDVAVAGDKHSRLIIMLVILAILILAAIILWLTLRSPGTAATGP